MLSPAKSAPVMRPVTTDLHSRASTEVRPPNIPPGCVVRAWFAPGHRRISGRCDYTPRGPVGSAAFFFLAHSHAHTSTSALYNRCVLCDMFQALRGRSVARSLLSASTLPLPPRCVAGAAAHRCLSKVANVPPSAPMGEGEPAAPFGQEQDAAGAGNDSTEPDVMADPRHVLLYEGSKVGHTQAASLCSFVRLSAVGRRFSTRLFSPRNPV